MTAGLTGRIETPWGEIGVTVRHGRLVGVELPPLHTVDAESLPVGATEREGGDPVTSMEESDPEDQAALERWIGELRAYCRGERLAWTAEDVSFEELGAGAFQRAVYRTLLSVPPAVTVSYGTLAEMSGYPRAARAVGTAMATNPVPIVIPCHRVIRSDGTLGNYGNDPSLKARLLAHEREHAGAQTTKT